MFRVKEWSTYQSYKDRSPPWIRFHVKLLDNYVFHKMTADARALLPMLWLLAAQHDDPKSGLIDMDCDEIGFKLRLDPITVKKTIDEIIRAGFIIRVENDIDLFTDKSTSYETVSETSRNHHPDPEIRDQSQKDQRKNSGKSVDKSVDTGDKSGSSKNGSLILDQGIKGYDIRDHLTETDWNEVSMAMRSHIHSSWDRKVVFEKYNNFTKSTPPKVPVKAFTAWLEASTWLRKPP